MRRKHTGQKGGIVCLALVLTGLLWFSGVGRTLASMASYGPVVVYFGQADAEISSYGKKMLSRLAQKMRDWPVEEVSVEGFTDEKLFKSGTKFDDNMDLSLARAEAIARFLQEKSGLPEDKFRAVGKGAITNGDEDGQESQEDRRRAEVRVLLKGEIPANLEEVEEVEPPQATVVARRLEPGSTPSRPAAVDTPVPAPPKRKIIAPLPAPKSKHKPITLTLRDASIAEVFEMLSTQERVNIVLGKGVEGIVSVNLYNMDLLDAIYTIAEAAGYGVEARPYGYMILPTEQLSTFSAGRSDMEVLTYKVQYAQLEMVEKTLTDYVSKQGTITTMEGTNMLVVKDTTESIERIKAILDEVDREPRQILIEGKILEVTLDNSEKFGLDWNRLFKSKGGTGTFGLDTFANTTATGFVASLQDSDSVNFVLNLLSTDGRVRTLSTPKLLALENQEAVVMVGDRQGYKVTTTINLVTTESVEFLESGIILKVTPSVDNQGRILMKIHPEVSTGSIKDGIPSQTTTEVSTDLLAEDAQPIFIGGLIKNKINKSKSGVPVLKDLPVMGKFFSSTDDTFANTETIVLITPHIVRNVKDRMLQEEREKVEAADRELVDESRMRNDSAVYGRKPGAVLAR